MKKLFIILILVHFQHHLNSTLVQNLCADARAKGFIFAPDPSNCSRYLYCDTTTNITIQLVCENPNYNIFRNDSCWSDRTITDCTSCPARNENIMYATDACRSYALCYKTVCGDLVNEGRCPTGQNFDRNSGLCVDAKFAPCIEPPPENKIVNCTGRSGTYVVIPNTNCTRYTFCLNDDNAIDDGWMCPPGEIFNSTSQICEVGPEGFICEYGKRSLEVLSLSNFINSDYSSEISREIFDHIPRAKIMRTKP